MRGPHPPAHQGRLLAAALRYAALGWPVFPLHTPTPGGCSCQQAGCARVGKHPRVARGLHAASTDPVRLAGWWRRWPGANVAIATGARSGLVVVDVDGAAGEATLQLLQETQGRLPATRQQRTGGGRHLVFAHPGTPVGNSTGRLGAGLDVRGDGGFIVAAPSRHHSGAVYAWTDLTVPAPPPGWLLHLLAPPQPQRPDERPLAPPEGSRYARAALAREAARVREAAGPRYVNGVKVASGTRNATLNAAAFALGTLVGAGALTANDVTGELLAAARSCGLPEGEARRTIASGLRAGAARPRVRA